MADGVPITAGSGTTILTDDCGAPGHAQVVKLAISTDGSGTLIPSDATNGLAVDITRIAAGTNYIGKVRLTDGTNDAVISSVGGLSVGGVVAHDAVDSGNPVKLGAKAIAHGSNPTAVAAADRTDLYANRHGILFMMGGHPNIVCASVHIADADGAQTNAAISPGTIGTGTKIVVTRITVTCDNANTTDVAVKIGFAATTLAADSTTGATGILADHDGIPPGGGFTIGDGSGILGIGGDGEELRLTCEDPVGGAVSITYSYYTIES